MKKFIYTAAEAKQAVENYQDNFIHSRTMRNVFKIIQAESKKGNKNHNFYFDSWGISRYVYNELDKLGYRLELSDTKEKYGIVQHILWVSW